MKRLLSVVLASLILIAFSSCATADTADADLLAGCTIATSGIISTVAKAASK